ncbi:efflux RND transporter periplasmic adaptor subunit [Candidatus Daviesbacteria bacterium]|nr:efflux RND transporter periplasmic adaptor subunit [Candidatus Daviesbacteria bacterium]
MRKIFRLPHIPKKFLIPIILILLVGGYFLFKPSKQEPIQTATVKRQDIKATVSASGILAGKNTADLKFIGSGKLAFISVQQGDIVKKGQSIAGLDTKSLQIALQEANNTYRDKQATVDNVLDQVKNNDTTETFTQKQNRTTAQVARDNAYDAVKAAKRAFDDVILYSPIDGTVTQASPLPGQFVAPTDLIAEIVDWSVIDFDGDVDESDISKINLGQDVEVSLNGYPDQTFKGAVDEILPKTKTTSSGATVVTVRINLANPNIHLIPGLNGQATIITATDNNVLTIPQEALKDDNTVIVQTQNGYMTKKVTTGLKSDADVEIKSGLTDGEVVVKNPAAVPSTQKSPTNTIFNRIFRLGRTPR